MKVLKFGGTSVGTAESLRQVKRIVEQQVDPVVVVVSALGGITDKLISTARMAASGNEEYRDCFSLISDRHVEVIEKIIEPDRRQEVMASVRTLLDELGNILRGISLIRDLSDRTLDIVVSYGERMSSRIVSSMIPASRLLDSCNFIRTRRSGGTHLLDTPATQKLVAGTFGAETPQVTVVPGFIARGEHGEITNLGRGGSDYTAAILASELGASELQIWTDVDGFMTADPRVIDKAYVIDSLSFIEAMELCNFGAKVVYPPTIYPVFHSDIPLLIKNTFNPDAPGTRVVKKSVASDKPIKGISSINDTCLITVTGLGMVGIVGVNARIFSTLARAGVSVFLVSQTASENNTSFAVKNADAETAVTVLREEFRKELLEGQISSITPRHNMATVAVVGENMRDTPGIAGKLYNTLGKNGINVVASAQGASEINISFVVELADLDKTLHVIHDSLFLSETQVLNIFLAGVGQVGRHLLAQIKRQQAKLLETKRLELRVVGIANSRRSLFNPDGIDIENYRDKLETEGVETTPGQLCDAIVAMNMYNSVFVDCTASKEVAAIYPELLGNSVNVVAANKIAASSDYSNYRFMKDEAQRRDIKFLFETNVGAGLPIISTINNFINSGDTILGVEAVVSGTMNFILDRVANGVPFSKAVTLAINEGYCEPDPRIDLSGSDVVRKITILARESGYHIEQSDVEVLPFVSPQLFEGDVESFIEALSTEDTRIANIAAEAAAHGQRLRYMATLRDDGHASVGLRTISADHPFYELESCNNVIAITTDRYHDYPIIIKGYGAGAEVTAAGVFADIINIANIR
ncbi:MAG: bifunctional aspartate kinase/homoserine dehydrogenase I [Muribaculaceae bacterium]|nr:bifunctional aspartate kinase/homoserine dehydrogenase I [Muribaculaceae bacterium]